jgi:hypothetical protein
MPHFVAFVRLSLPLSAPAPFNGNGVGTKEEAAAIVND